MKLPNLIEHFVSHKIDNNDLSLYAFFKMHYLDEQTKDKDYSEDMKLPFKTHDFSGAFIMLSTPPEKPNLNIEYHLVYVDDSRNFSYSEKFLPSVFQKIWEPPKI
ncbi:hypothetical protein [Kaistella sp.]|uniref:hypothetical protein n=1 Tax=Kaistella sp. TaxID=2782235 RepID=UPI003C398A05